MPPAARVGDLTAHGTPLSQGGSPNVLINGRPAWRASDFHICPLSSGNIPHVGGFAIGSSTVLINGVPAVRQGDAIIENGITNTVVTGSPNVLIG